VVRQEPQLAGSYCVSTHWTPAVVQTVAPGSQEQAPAPQVPSPQDLSHAPQWAGLLARLTQTPLQVSGAVAGHWQLPARQLAPLGQAWRQVPQENGLACRSRQTPLQTVWPAGQLTGLVPPEQPMATAAAMAATVAARVRRVGEVMWPNHSLATGRRIGEGMDRWEQLR
jgi:hypothetical protein